MSIQSVSRAFTILRTIANHPNGIGITELARRMNIHKSTVSRLVATLEQERAIERAESGNGLRIGEGIYNLISMERFPFSLVRMLQPCLNTLVDQVGESVGLSIRDEDYAVTIAQLQSRHAVQVRDWTGERFPMHVSSGGKHFLASADYTELETYMSRQYARYTPSTICDYDTLAARLIQVRRDGFDWTFDEFEEGLVAVSAPVYDTLGYVAASIYVCGPIFRFPADGQKELVTEQLLDVCQTATSLLVANDFTINEKSALLTAF